MTPKKLPVAADDPLNEMPVTVDLQLLSVLQEMVADLTDSDNHYFVSANYVDFVDSSREYKRRYMCPIYVHQDSVSGVDFDEQGILLDTFFSPGGEAPLERIHIRYDQIYAIARNRTGGVYTDEDRVYFQASTFKMPPIR